MMHAVSVKLAAVTGVFAQLSLLDKSHAFQKGLSICTLKQLQNLLCQRVSVSM